MKHPTITLTFAVFVVALIAAPVAHSKPPKGAAATVGIKGMKYAPAGVGVKVGESVTWVNNDERDHTVVAADGSFNSGNIGPGKSFSFRFTKAGKFAYSCGLHPRMGGSVTVQ